jgi:hypothetical protein
MLKEPLHFPLEILERGIERFATWIDDNRPLWIQPIEVEAHGLPDAPLDAVPRHRLAQAAGRREPDVRTGRLRLAQAEGREQRAGKPGALVIDSSEIFRSQEADTFRKTRDGALPLGTDGEFFPASGPAARKHRATIFGLHAAAKSVRLRTVTIIRLKGAFRHFSSSI